MSGSYSSPFEPSGADAQQPGMLGLSPDLWRTIAQFGGAMSQAANARTPSGHLANGTGFLGPLGAATGDAFKQAQILAELRSRLASQAAQTGHTQAQIPLVRAQTQGALAQVPHIQAQTGLLGAQTGQVGAETVGKNIANTVAGAQAGPEVILQDIRTKELEKEREKRYGPRADAPAGTTYWSALNAAEGTGQNSRSSSAGFGGFIKKTWENFAKENPQYFQGMNSQQILDARHDPTLREGGKVLGNIASDWLVAKHAPILKANGVTPNGPALGLAHMTGASSAVALLKADPRTPVTQVLATVLSPKKLNETIEANPDWASKNAGQLIATRAHFPDFVSAGPRAWSNPDQVWDEAVQQSGGQQQVAGQIAPRTATGESPSPFQVAQAGPGALPVPGQPVIPQAAAQPQALNLGRPGPDPEHLADAARREDALGELRYKRFIKLQDLSPDAEKVLEQGIQDARARAYEGQKAWDVANAQRVNRVTEGGPGVIARDANQRVLSQNPISQKIIGPDGISYDVKMYTVPVPGYKRPANVPEWAPEGTLDVQRSERGPGETTAQTESARDAFGEKARSGFASALNSQRQLTEMEAEFDTLNAQPGWYSTGTGAEWKMRTGRTINTLAQSLGGKPVFNEEKLAAGEDIVKLSKLLGMQVLTSAFGGSREAASIVESTQKAVPGLDNTPMGAKLLLSSMKEGSQFLVDQHAFMAEWYQSHKGDMVGADVAFAKAFSPNKYALRAISQVKPYAISDPKEYSRYLPGTRIIKKGGDPSDVRIVPDVQ